MASLIVIEPPFFGQDGEPEYRVLKYCSFKRTQGGKYMVGRATTTFEVTDLPAFLKAHGIPGLKRKDRKILEAHIPVALELNAEAARH